MQGPYSLLANGWHALMEEIAIAARTAALRCWRGAGVFFVAVANGPQEQREGGLMGHITTKLINFGLF